MTGPEKPRGNEEGRLRIFQRVRKQLRENPKVYYAGEIALSKADPFAYFYEGLLISHPTIKFHSYPFGKNDDNPDVEVARNIIIAPKKAILSPEELNRFKNNLLTEKPAVSTDFEYYGFYNFSDERQYTKEIEVGNLLFNELIQKGKFKILEATSIKLYPSSDYAQFIFDQYENIKAQKLTGEDAEGLFLFDATETSSPIFAAMFPRLIDMRDRMPETLLKMVKDGKFNYLESKIDKEYKI